MPAAKKDTPTMIGPVLFDRYTMTVDLIEPLLGTVPLDKEVLDNYVADLERKGADEVIPEPPEGVSLRGTTGFFVDDNGDPVMMNYQVKGWLKEVSLIIKDNLGITAPRSHIDRDVFVSPRRKTLGSKEELDELQRPLRAMTMQGPRVSLVKSKMINPPQTWTWTLEVRQKSKITLPVLQAIAGYGRYLGFGQWRNGGYGTIEVTIEPADSGEDQMIQPIN